MALLTDSLNLLVFSIPHVWPDLAALVRLAYITEVMR